MTRDILNFRIILRKGVQCGHIHIHRHILNARCVCKWTTEKGTNLQQCHSHSFYEFYSSHFEYNQNKAPEQQALTMSFFSLSISLSSASVCVCVLFSLNFAFSPPCWLNDFKCHFVVTIEYSNSLPFVQMNPFWIQIRTIKGLIAVTIEIEFNIFHLTRRENILVHTYKTNIQYIFFKFALLQFKLNPSGRLLLIFNDQFKNKLKPSVEMIDFTQMHNWSITKINYNGNRVIKIKINDFPIICSLDWFELFVWKCQCYKIYHHSR